LISLKFSDANESDWPSEVSGIQSSA